MSRWTERPLPYERPDPPLRSPEAIQSFIGGRTKTGLDASLFFELDDEYRRLRIVEMQKKRREDKDNRITEADLQSHPGRPRKSR